MIIYRFIKRKSLIITIVLPILVVAYAILFPYGVLRDAYPFHQFLQIKAILTPIIAIGFLIFFPALALSYSSIPKSRSSPFLRLIVLATGLAIGVPMCFTLGVFALRYPETISSAVQFDHQNYYVTNEGQFGDMWTTYRFFKCNEQELECVEIYQFAEGGSWIRPIALVVDQNLKEVHLFMGGYSCDLVYTYNEQSHEYDIEASVTVDPYHFAIWSYNRNQDKEFLFTKCNFPCTNSVACEILPFRYSTRNFNHVELLQEANAPIIDLYMDGQLIFTYDPAGSQCHAEGCSIPEEDH